MSDQQSYPIEQAIKLVKENSKERFDASVEIHIRLGIDPKKGEQQVRGYVSLPHGSGKLLRVAVFADGNDVEKAKSAGADIAGGEDLINEIKSSAKVDFDVAVTHPGFMSKLTQIAKILGPKGLMPSPKDGTVTQQIEQTVKELKAGKISFKNDDTANLHSIIGKVSFETDKLVENFSAFIETVRKFKPSGVKGEYIKSISISSTMGKSIKVMI